VKRRFNDRMKFGRWEVMKVSHYFLTQTKVCYPACASTQTGPSFEFSVTLLTIDNVDIKLCIIVIELFSLHSKPRRMFEDNLLNLWFGSNPSTCSGWK